MKIYKRFKTGSVALITFLIIGQTGCSSPFFADNSNLCIGDNGVYQRCAGASGLSQNDGNKRMMMHELLPEYVEQLAMRLVDNMQVIDVQDTIAITSLVSFDSNLRQGDLLGNQLSELLYSELQQLDLSLVDFNVRDYIEPTATGAFSLSREYNEYDDLPFEYVLTGTWIKAKKGIMVNARIVGLYNKKVITTASMLIPNFIISTDYHR